MIRRDLNGIQWLEFELLTDIPDLTHGVFLRHGGVSIGECASLNVSYARGDNPIHVTTNINKIAQTLNLSTWISSNQCHGKAIFEIADADKAVPYPCDALITRCPNIGLLMNHADCQIAIFYDPVNHAIANVHAGWRGNVANIYQETVQYMQHTYFSKAEDLLVCISPSLGPNHAEFINYRTELPEHFWEHQIKPFYFDLWAVSKMQLMQSGVLPHHIQIAEICTYTNTQDYFSHRRQKLSGRHATVVSLTC